MPTISSSQIDPPENWEEFEDICRDLWEKIWNDPNTQKNGRQGQPQNGVDVFGRPNQGEKWAGVQCKRKDILAGNALTEEELLEEIGKAKSFDPDISEFIIAITGPRDQKIQKLARLITEKHLKKGLFSVHVWSWNDIKDKLAEYDKLINKHYPHLSKRDEILNNQINDMNENFENQLIDLNSSIGSIDKKLVVGNVPLGLSSDLLTTEHQRELKHAKDLIDNLKIEDSLTYLIKLKSDIWDKASPIVKYGILKYMGSAKQKLLKNEEAGLLFVEAYQYNPDTEESLFIKALGHLLLNQKEKANLWAKKVLEKNEANFKAYAIIAETTDNNLVNIISEIPEEFRETEDVAYTIGFIARIKNNLNEAEKWLRIALKKNEGNSPDLKANLGEVIQMKLSDDPYLVYTDEIDTSMKEKLKEVEVLLEEAWDSICDIQMQRARISWLANLSTVKLLLNDLKGAEKYIDLGIKIDPSNPFFEKNRAFLLLNTGKAEDAKDILMNIGVKDSQAPLILAFQLKDEEKYLEAIETLENALKVNSDESFQYPTHKLLIELYLITKNVDEARKLYNSFFDSRNDISSKVYKAHISRLEGDNEAYINIINEAKSSIIDLTTPQELSMLADEFYKIGKLKDASEIYEKFVDKEVNSNLTHRLIDCYYRSGEIGNALNLCQTLVEKYKTPLEYISEVAISILVEIDELEEAKTLINQYLAVFSTNLDMRINQAIINLHSNHSSEVDNFLKSPIDLNKLSLEQFKKLAYLYHFRGFEEQTYLEIIYNMRRKYFNEYDAHAEYFKSLLFKYTDSESTPIKVTWDMAVCLKNNSSKREEWFILEKREDADFKSREINQDNPLSKELIGKYIGETVTIGQGVSSTEVIIEEIQSKYIYASQESGELLKYSSDNFGLFPISLGSDEKNKFKPLLDVLKDRRDHIHNAEKTFNEKIIPVGAFAKFTGSNLIDTWNHIINNSDLSLKCDSKNSIGNLLTTKKKLIIDIVSLLTIHETKIKDNIVKTFGKLGIAQSTINEIVRALTEQKMLKERGSSYSEMSSDDEFRLYDINSKSIERNINYLEDLLDWIKHNCDVISCKAALKINRKVRVQFNNLLTKSFMDTILIASEEGNLFYSDDGPLRLIAKEKFGVNGIWTQEVLLECLKRNNITINDYNKIIVKLLSFNYSGINYNSNTLILAAEEAEFKLSNPYTNIIDFVTLENNHPNIPEVFVSLNISEAFLKDEADINIVKSSIRVLHGFISKISEQKISIEQQNLLINYFLCRIACRTDGNYILYGLSVLLVKKLTKRYNSLMKKMDETNL